MLLHVSGKESLHVVEILIANAFITPMPLYANGIAIGGTGLPKDKADGKRKRDGPCAGTKGFKAPEVLFRSLHQGPKTDVWLAGATLLYLMIGCTPFVGDNDQNIKESKVTGKRRSVGSS